MKKMKKSLRTLMCVIAVLTMTFTSAVTAMAETMEAESTDVQLTTAQETKATVWTAAKLKTAKLNLKKVASYSYNKIKITWEPLEGVDGYQIYRSTSKPGIYTKMYTAVGASKSTYINSKSITTGKTYYYKVRAYKKINGKTVYSKFSAVMSAYARPNKVKMKSWEYMSSPEQLGTDSKYVLYLSHCLKWNKVDGATGYTMQVREKSEGVWRSYYQYGSRNTKSYALSTKGEYITSTTGAKVYWYLDDGKDYEFRVRAYRIVNGKRVYGLYSEPMPAEIQSTPKMIVEAMEKYIKEKYPSYSLYSDEERAKKKIGVNMNYGIEWGTTFVNKYQTIEEIMDYISSSIDMTIRRGLDNKNPNVIIAGSGAGFPYVYEVTEENVDTVVYKNKIGYYRVMLVY